MAFIFFNTLGREKQLFTPLQKGKVGFYGCGPTVYNYAHIGNLRAYVHHDILVRSLRRAGYEVNHVMNITDVG
ncbi:MAG: cysteine--tRNA ligase, partial [Treponema sp.]|nr:cysteine--tRNA ligase [Treponema sp.]